MASSDFFFFPSDVWWEELKETPVLVLQTSKVHWSCQLLTLSIYNIYPRIFITHHCCLFLVSRMRKRPVISVKYFGLSNVQVGDKVCLFVFKKILGKYIGEYLANFWEHFECCHKLSLFLIFIRIDRISKIGHSLPY